MKNFYSNDVVQADDPSDILRQIAQQADIDNDIAQMDIMQARRQKILKQTEYLSQKITAKKEQLFSQWSQRFYIVFEKNFSKFKNSLIQLGLNDKQVKRLSENLQCAIVNLSKCLDDIKSDYMQAVQNEEDV